MNPTDVDCASTDVGQSTNVLTNIDKAPPGYAGPTAAAAHRALRLRGPHDGRMHGCCGRAALRPCRECTPSDGVHTRDVRIAARGIYRPTTRGPHEGGARGARLWRRAHDRCS